MVRTDVIWSVQSHLTVKKMPARKKRGCCVQIRLREDNIRFILLAVLMVIYTLTGASIFMFLERDNEIKERDKLNEIYREFLANNAEVNRTELDYLLKHYADATQMGILNETRHRWDFAGSFYFVGTVVSTIGFGMTTPQTIPGKVVLIFYGFLGCAGAILFFNLFLERIITFLAFILRYIHEHDLKRKGLLGKDTPGVGGDVGRRNSHSSEEEDNLDSWKPSVYWVMLILLVSAVVVALCASSVYHPVEGWTYFEAIYFCFVTFATIGFGDYVVSQSAHYQNVHLYRFANFIFIVIGCCCIYSLFNVTSIVIKQFLNWLIKKGNMTCKICRRPHGRNKPRRNAIIPGQTLKKDSHKMSPELTDDSNYDSDSERRGSGEMISMKDFLQTNKISLAMMQKQLYETAHKIPDTKHNGGGLRGGIGPLAILNKKLGHDDV